MKRKHLNLKNKISQLDIKRKIEVRYRKGLELIQQHIRFQILFMVVIAFLSASVIFMAISHFINHTIGEYTYITYKESREIVQERLIETVAQINRLEEQSMNYTQIKNILESNDESEMTEDGISKGIQQLAQEINDITGEELFTIEEVQSLYKELKTSFTSGKLTEETYREMIKGFFLLQGEDLEQVKLERIKGWIENLRQTGQTEDLDLFLVDGTGQLLYKAGFIEKLDLVKVIQKINSSTHTQKESFFNILYPVIIEEKVCYLYAEGNLAPFQHKAHTGLGSFLGLLSATAIFIILVFKLTKDKIAYIEYLSTCLGEIAKGDLSYKIEVVGSDELARVAQNITIMEQEIKHQISDKEKAQQTKNELITNVAHDLRTPLTSIIGYIGLVKNKGYHTLEEQQQYLGIAYLKAEKLKILIEDLFELTKFYQKAITLHKEDISLSNLINQLIQELTPLAAEKNLQIETYIKVKQSVVKVDAPKITRVFENIIENAIKYSPEDETIYIELREINDFIYVAVSNRCQGISAEDAERFFERFHRADQSRNSEIGGSGLGLAIAKNIIELHQGKITVKVKGDLISFKVGLLKA